MDRGGNRIAIGFGRRVYSFISLDSLKKVSIPSVPSGERVYPVMPLRGGNWELGIG
jgi:hypothetical protein